MSMHKYRTGVAQRGKILPQKVVVAWGSVQQLGMVLVTADLTIMNIFIWLLIYTGINAGANG